MWGRALFTGGLLATLLADASAAEPNRADSRRHRVDVEVDAEAAVVARVRAVATEVLERLDVIPVVTRESAQSSDERGRHPPPLAYAYIDLEVPTSPRLVIVDGASQRELARRSLPETTSLETSIEAVTLVLYMTLESMLARTATTTSERSATEPGGAQPAAAPTARPPEKAPLAPSIEPALTPSAARQVELDAGPDAADEKSDALAVDVGAFLRVTTLDGANALAGGGLAVEVRAGHLSPRFGALVLAAAHTSQGVAFGSARVHVTPLSARLLPTVSVLLAPRISGLFGLGGGIDWVRTEVRDVPAGAVGGGTGSVMNPTVSALVGARAHFNRYFSMNLAGGLDLDASPRAFVVRVGGERRPLLELSRVRPSVMLGFAFSPTGATP